MLIPGITEFVPGVFFCWTWKFAEQHFSQFSVKQRQLGVKVRVSECLFLRAVFDTGNDLGVC